MNCSLAIVGGQINTLISDQNGHYYYYQQRQAGCKVILLIEGWAFIWAQELKNRHLIKTKVIIVRPIDVTSHLYDWLNDGL